MKTVPFLGFLIFKIIKLRNLLVMFYIKHYLHSSINLNFNKATEKGVLSKGLFFLVTFSTVCE